MIRTRSPAWSPVVAALCLTLLLVAGSSRAADDDNPYKNAKIGDYVTYKMDMKVGGIAIASFCRTTTTKECPR